jgi:hypothetical protein
LFYGTPNDQLLEKKMIKKYAVKEGCRGSNPDYPQNYAALGSLTRLCIMDTIIPLRIPLRDCGKPQTHRNKFTGLNFNFVE